MQFNTTESLMIALTSAGVGFGLAYFLEKKISEKLKGKPQRTFIFIAMTSFGFGLMSVLNELLNFQFQGFQIRYDKLVIFVLVNIVFLPLLFIGAAKLFGAKDVVKNIQTDDQINGSTKKLPIYIILLLLVSLVGYIVFTKFFVSSASATYDFYVRSNKSCTSAFSVDPSYSLKFSHKKDTEEIYVIVDIVVDGKKVTDVKKLDNCNVLDQNNWSCEGEWIGTYLSPKYTFVDGEFSYHPGYGGITEGGDCHPRIVKR